MIEESTLPKRCSCRCLSGMCSSSAARDGGSYNPFQPSHPHTEIEIMTSWHKQMDVIRHNDVTA